MKAHIRMAMEFEISMNGYSYTVERTMAFPTKAGFWKALV